MTTLKQIMNLVDAYGSERCSGNEYDNRYAEKRARDAVVSALKEYAPQHIWVGLTDEEFKRIMLDTYNIDLNVPGHSSDDNLLWRAIEAKLKEKNT